MNFFAEFKQVLAMLILSGALALFIVYEMPEQLIWAVIIAIAGLAGYQIFKNGTPK